MTNGLKPRERILQVASDLFYSRGIHAVGVDEIVARSSAAKTTLYHHFASKDDLVAAYLKRWSDLWRLYVEEELDRSSLASRDQIDLVFQLLANSCEAADFKGCPFSKASAEFPDPAHPARIVSETHRVWLRMLFVRLATDAGAVDPDLLADWLCLLHDAAMNSSHLEPGAEGAQKSRAAALVLVDSMLPRHLKERTCR